jgi:hypothetical protein
MQIRENIKKNREERKGLASISQEFTLLGHHSADGFKDHI